VCFQLLVLPRYNTGSQAAVSWAATLSGGGVELELFGKLEMDSYMSFEVRLSSSDMSRDMSQQASSTASAPVSLTDVQLVVVANAVRRMLLLV
jgi:hypothetical protein